jgi:hypothetical protein
MNGFWRIRRVFLIGLSLAGCGPASPEATVGVPGAPKPARTLRIGVMPRLMGISYFNACRAGAAAAAAAAAREQGVELTVHVARQLAAKKLVPGTANFGRLRDITVTGDEVILGPPLVFDRENPDRYGF